MNLEHRYNKYQLFNNRDHKETSQVKSKKKKRKKKRFSGMIKNYLKKDLMNWEVKGQTCWTWESMMDLQVVENQANNKTTKQYQQLMQLIEIQSNRIQETEQ